MNKLIRLLARVRFEVVLLVVACLFLAIAFLDQLPAPANGWQMHVRVPFSIGLLAVGCALFLAAIFFALFEVRGTSPGTLFHPRPSTSRVLSAWALLGKKQQFIMKYVYKIYEGVSEVSVDELFATIEAKEAGVIVSKGDLYYRLESLKTRGMVDLRSLHPRKSIVAKVPAVAEVLEKHHKIWS